MAIENAAAAGKLARVNSIDFLRGLVIIIMALDHVRDYVTDVRFDPLSLDETNVALYFTRWITHFCAPAFVFLAGTSAGFQRQAGKTGKDLSLFLLTRGIWLVFLEITVVKLGWMFALAPSLYFLQVIWAIGVSMVVLAGLVWLPVRVVAAIGAIMIVGHNLFGGIDAAVASQIAQGGGAPVGLSFGGAFWALLHIQSPLQFGPVTVFVAYPLIPWIGVMALGYGFAELYTKAEAPRRSTLLKIGLGMTAAFFLLRLINLYGDPSQWALQDSAVKTVLSFFNTTKYPPSLLFLLMTLGPSIAILSWSEKWKGRLFDVVVTFGRVPLFFYVLHIYMAHLAAVLLGAAQGYPVAAFTNFFIFFPSDYGVGLLGVYIFWIAVVALLYFPCWWFADLKKRSSARWLSYF